MAARAPQKEPAKTPSPRPTSPPSAPSALLTDRRPDDFVCGEEEACTDGTSGLTWVVDPIDGTRSFISDMPLWGIVIGLKDGYRGRIGVIDQPNVRERFAGFLRGRGLRGSDPDASRGLPARERSARERSRRLDGRPRRSPAAAHPGLNGL